MSYLLIKTRALAREIFKIAGCATIWTIFVERWSYWLLKTLLWFGLIGVGCLNLVISAASLQSPYIYLKDLLQEYVLAKAVQTGVDPYQSLPILVDKFVGIIPAAILPHPTPHPPPIALAFYPLAWLTFEQSAYLWYAIELVLLFALARQLATWVNRSVKPYQTLGLALALLSWQPFLNDLRYGQITLLIVTLVFSAALSWKFHRPILAGSFLGAAIALKLFVWPILIWLALKRKWQSVVSALFVVVIANLAAFLVMGLERTLHYYSSVVTQTTPYYTGFGFNYSLYTFGWRVFAGTGSQVLISFIAPPLLDAPTLAPFISFLIVGGLLLFSWFAALQARSFEGGLAIMTTACVLASPITWVHYFQLLLVPAAWLFSRRENNPKLINLLALVIAALLWIFSDQKLEAIALWLAGSPPSSVGQVQIPFWAGAITFGPILCVITLLFVAVGASKKDSRQ